MSTPTAFNLKAGVPYSRRLRITDGTLVWASLDDFEVRWQVRTGTSDKYPLVFDVTPFLTVSLDDSDIVIDLAMTGADTRAAKSGYYDVLVSDVGTVDARALPPIAYGRFDVEPVITSAADVA